MTTRALTAWFFRRAVLPAIGLTGVYVAVMMIGVVPMLGSVRGIEVMDWSLVVPVLFAVLIALLRRRELFTESNEKNG
jgi:hypothetical protein